MDQQPVESLIDLLAEQHPVYGGQSRAAVTRMRGWILLAFSRHGTPTQAVPFVMEELESGIDAYTVAAAAKTLHGSPGNHEVRGMLLKALENLRYRDDNVCFDAYGSYSKNSADSSAREIIRDVLESLQDCEPAVSNSNGSQTTQSCCAHQPATFDSADLAEYQWQPEQFKLEDHDGRILDYAGFFCGIPTILVFFYTRCENPHKCPLTMHKLSQIQQRIDHAEFQTAAISYDPTFDTPARLRAYAKTFGLHTTDQHRLFRTIDDFDKLSKFLNLGVGRVGSIVNRHQIEAFVIDACGNPVFEARRKQWTGEELIMQVQSAA